MATPAALAEYGADMVGTNDSKSSAHVQTFQSRLKAARLAKRLDQAALAERAGLQTSAISHFETGRRTPSFDNLKKLVDALGVTADYLLGRVAEPGASGPALERIFRETANMAAVDMDFLADIAEKLAEKHT